MMKRKRQHDGKFIEKHQRKDQPKATNSSNEENEGKTLEVRLQVFCVHLKVNRRSLGGEYDHYHSIIGQ